MCGPLLPLRVRWESMETEFHEGDIIVVNPYLKPEHNEYVVVSNEEGEATFKQLKKYGRARVLHPLNPKYDDIELRKDTEYTVIGVVVEKKKRYRWQVKWISGVIEKRERFGSTSRINLIVTIKYPWAR